MVNPGGKGITHPVSARLSEPPRHLRKVAMKIVVVACTIIIIAVAFFNLGVLLQNTFYLIQY
jgi:hypothetical protein